MDLKLTKKRIGDHLTYDWTKYVALLVVCVLAVSLFFNIFARRLTDKEELKVVLFGKYVSEFEETYLDYMKGATALFDSTYVDTTIEYFASQDDYYAEKAATAKIEAELLGSGMGADVLVLPIVEGLLDENGDMFDENGNRVGGTYFDTDKTIKDFAPYSFNYRVGRNYFIPIDEVIESEIQKGNPLAVELKNKLSNNDYYYCCQRIAADDENPDQPRDLPVYDEHGKIIKANFGIDLNKLDTSKTAQLISDRGVSSDDTSFVCNYVIGIRRESLSHAEAICFLNWLIDCYA